MQDSREKLIRLNVGCGPDYRDGWLNIDACPDMFRVDLGLVLPCDKLAQHFGEHTVDEIYMSDVMEHFYRWDGIEVLKDFYKVLKPGGIATIVTPDLERLITINTITLQRKLELIRGYQGQSNLTIQPGGQLWLAWQAHTKMFSHPYTWTDAELTGVMKEIGFEPAGTTWRCDWEMIVTGKVPVG